MRQPSGDCVHRIAEAGGALELVCMGGTLSADPLYEHRMPA